MYSDSYWSFGPVMNNLLLDKTKFYCILPHVWRTLDWHNGCDVNWSIHQKRPYIWELDADLRIGRQLKTVRRSESYIYTLSVNIKLFCTRCETGQKSLPKASFSTCGHLVQLWITFYWTKPNFTAYCHMSDGPWTDIVRK
jgi:hypothetical protein